MGKTWRETTLWSLLQARPAAGGIRHAVEAVLNPAEAVLKHGGTIPKDFTLHDAEHASRVAQRMVELLPDPGHPPLSDQELGLLLLSAYLHDIGMCPEQAWVDRHRGFLLGQPAGDGLSSAERDAFRKWIYTNYPEIEPPLDAAAAAAVGSGSPDEILAYYVRHRHNDLSEMWIGREVAPLVPDPPYPEWQADLVALCRSHHEGLPELRKSRFNARLIPGSGVVNLRYLAALLRLADVLEFDPERTPQVVLRHRNIAPGSRIYWSKDHGIAFDLQREPPRMMLAARPRDAVAYRAVQETQHQVDAELACCHALHSENSFAAGMIPDAKRGDYKWIWPAALQSDIREQEEQGRKSFVYLDGTFRPDVEHVLTLLGGLELYGTPLAAVRELLQNAFDAVHEQIAYQRVRAGHGADPGFADAVAQLHEVSLALEQRDGAWWLVCRDSGVGMTKAIIERQLLVAGARTRPEVRDLERQARELGFEIGRTGQFGIGVLSYFMLADELHITTRRSQDAGGDPDNTGWSFVIAGLSDFGELRRVPRDQLGSEVALRLKPEFVEGGADALFGALNEFLDGLLIRLPCRFRLTGLDSSSVLLNKGWFAGALEPQGWRVIAAKNTILSAQTRSFQEIAERAVTDQIELAQQMLQSLEGVLDRAANAIRFFGTTELDIPDVGHALLAIPFYECEGGQSLLFFDNANEGQIHSIPFFEAFSDHTNIGQAMRLDIETVQAWRGFSVSNVEFENETFADVRGHRGDTTPVALCIDYTHAMRLTANRTHLTVRNSAFLVDTVRKKARELAIKYLQQHANSAFIWFDAQFLLQAGLIDEMPHAFKPTYVTSDSKKMSQINKIDAIQFPALLKANNYAPEYIKLARIDHGKQEKPAAVEPLTIVDGRRKLTMNPLNGLASDRIGLFFGKEAIKFESVISYKKQNSLLQPLNCSVVEFPATWASLMAIIVPSIQYQTLYMTDRESGWLNERYSISQALCEKGRSDIAFDQFPSWRDIGTTTWSPITAEQAAVWLFNALADSNFNLLFLTDRAPDLARSLLDVLSRAGSLPLRILRPKYSMIRKEHASHHALVIDAAGYRTWDDRTPPAAKDKISFPDGHEVPMSPSDAWRLLPKKKNRNQAA